MVRSEADRQMQTSSQLTTSGRRSRREKWLSRKTCQKYTRNAGGEQYLSLGRGMKFEWCGQVLVNEKSVRKKTNVISQQSALRACSQRQIDWCPARRADLMERTVMLLFDDSQNLLSFEKLDLNGGVMVPTRVPMNRLVYCCYTKLFDRLPFLASSKQLHAIIEFKY